ncbi:hypothetical protein D3C80_1945830 [compost metagenome]
MLSRDGLHVGCAARTETYRLLESTVYNVNDEFPSITPLSFSSGAMPVGIVAIEYDVDLSALKGLKF